MAISFEKYVDIVSGVGGGNAVRTRDLIARLFTTNPLLPPQSKIDCESAAEVGDYFGYDSEEYARALFYFGWISKNSTTPQMISFARWVDAAVAPRVYGKVNDYVLANFTSISAGSIIVKMGSFDHEFTGIDLSGAASLAAVAALIQTAIRTYSAGGALYTSATVSYDATRKSFNLVGGSTGAANMEIEAGETGTDVASPLGWLTGSIQSDGSAAETVTETLTSSAGASDNFGSFAFIPALTDDQIEDAALWNQTQNVKFQYQVPVLAADAEALSELLFDIAGVGLTLSPTAGEYPEMAPMMILAATDYDSRDAVQNYMFQQFDLTPSVSTDADADLYDGLRVNYYGVTQTAGQLLEFYQDGVLMGGATEPTDMNVYANEQWLKDYIGSLIMSLLLSVGRVPANVQGRAMIMTTIQTAITLALTNGTISVGKPLDNTQKLYINQQTGDPLAWNQVQNIGYWLDVVMEKRTRENSTTYWVAVYKLIYSKDDAIRKVEGTHNLI